MRRIILTFIIALLLTTFLTTSCVTTNTKRDPKIVQEEFNQDAIYFIQTDGALLIDYLDKDQNLTIRDKQVTKRRYRNLINLIEQMQ